MQGYPSIKVFGKNKRAFPTDYQGARTAEALVASLRETAEEEAAKPPAPSLGLTGGVSIRRFAS